MYLSNQKLLVSNPNGSEKFFIIIEKNIIKICIIFIIKWKV